MQTDQAGKFGVTYGTRRQDDIFPGRYGILGAGSTENDAGGGLAVIKNNSLHLRRLIELKVSRLAQSSAQEGRLGRGPGLPSRIDRIGKVRLAKETTIGEPGKSCKS